MWFFLGFLYGLGIGASYIGIRAATRGYFDRKYKLLTEHDPNHNRGFSLWWPILPALYWPIGWVMLYYLSERFYYGFKWK